MAKFATSQAAVGFYHWPFLVNVELAAAMIMAFGGGDFVRSSMECWHGHNEAGLRS